MKLTTLETLCVEFIDDLLTAEAQAEEIELAFETMLSSDVIEFLKMGCKPFAKKLSEKVSSGGLDEHELAMA